MGGLIGVRVKHGYGRTDDDGRTDGWRRTDGRMVTDGRTDGWILVFHNTLFTSLIRVLPIWVKRG